MRVLTMLAVALWSCAVAFAQETISTQGGPPPELPPLSHFSPDIVDHSVDPCNDFYAYSCGRWHQAHPMPADQPVWGTASVLDTWNQTLLGQALARLARGEGIRSGDERKLGDFYGACMDEPGIEARGLESLQPELRRIAAIRTLADLSAALAHVHQVIPGAWIPSDNQTNSPLLGFSGQPDLDDASSNIAQFDQGGMSLPGRSYYLDKDEKSVAIRQKFLKHVERMLVLSGEQPGAAGKDAATILAMETDLARAATDPVTRRDPRTQNNKLSRAQLRSLAPSFDFDAYLKAVGAPPAAVYNVTAPGFFKGAERTLRTHPVAHWQAYLRWHLLSGTAPALPKAFVEEHFDFFGRTLAGTREMEPRWKRCVASVDANLGEALGRVYVTRAFPRESKERVVALVRDLDAALSGDIDSLSWMSTDTKKQAHVKLGATLEKIGYPDHDRDIATLEVGRESYFGNRARATAFEFARWVTKVGTRVDRSEWGMTASTVNAYEDSPTNTINFPAGILQPPLFDATQDESVNYGGIGATIGHEIIHGFDDQGRKFDAQGNLRDWWTAEDAKEYESRDKCISDQYSQLVPEAGVKQDGRMTLGEDTADNGGLRIAYMALEAAMARQGRPLIAKEADGLTPQQRFFMSYAFGWCSVYQPELIRRLVLTDPHSYPRYRVNNSVANMPEFAEAFACHKGQAEVRENACRVW
jgi:endothelin-converting enzyme/putative endopeptidase